MNKENNKKDIKVEDHIKNINIKTFFQKAIFQIDLKKVFMIKKIKILCRGCILLMILTVKKLLECFTKRNCKQEVGIAINSWIYK